MPFVSRREKNARKIENIFKMSAPVPHIEPIPHGRSFHSNPDIRNWRSNSAHIRHFDQSQSYENYERRPVSFRVKCFNIFIYLSAQYVCNRYHQDPCHSVFETVWRTVTHRDRVDRLLYQMELFKCALEMA